MSKQTVTPVMAQPVTMVDLFAGCGGLALGFLMAAAEYGHELVVQLAVDTDPDAMAVYAANLPVRDAVIGPVELMFDGALGAPPTPVETRIASRIGRLDCLVGGPPCQGSSALNNHTRHKDPRNALYARMARAAEVLRPRLILIENVPDIRRDSEGVIAATVEALMNAGYSCTDELIRMERLGVPQLRHRHVLLAVAEGEERASTLLAGATAPCGLHGPRTVEWAFTDLRPKDPMFFDAPSAMTAANRARIDWLFDNESYDLPNELRPACHRSAHSYHSMYGRLRADGPAQTVTSGFMTMGQGRYVHPTRRRTLTPHEAARLQTFPDWFSFDRARTRRGLASMIGNAVPPLANLVIGRRVLSTIVRRPGVTTAA